ncbi:MAG: DUF2378 family protein [Myxococcota bacterium]
MQSEATPIPRRTLEALLRPEIVSVTPELEAELKALGIDVSSWAPKYTVRQLRQAMELVRAHTLSELPVERGYRELGRRFVLAFKQTPVGWIFSAMAPLFGPDLTMQTLPRYLSSVRDDFPISVIAEKDHRYRFIYRDETQYPDFIAGSVEVVLETCGLTTYEVRWEPQPPGFELVVSWSKTGG